MDFVIMGVSGCGKSTIARRLSERLNAQFIEGDDFHPTENVLKMSSGEPLTDADREPWLELLAEIMQKAQAENQPFVLSCSSLKKRYREILAKDNSITFIYLKGSVKEITGRLQHRKNHFMPADLIHSQFAALEEPTLEERAISVSIDQSIDGMLREIDSKILHTMDRGL